MAFDWGAAGGAIIGAGVGAGITVAAANGLDQKRDCHKMTLAMTRISQELKENARRDTQKLGNWEASKESLSALSLRDRSRPLWKELSDVYGAIYESSKGMKQGGKLVEPPSPATLLAVAGSVEAERKRLKRELRRPWPFGRG